MLLTKTALLEPGVKHKPFPERAHQGSEALISSTNRAAGKDFNSAISQQKGSAGVRCQTTALEAAAIFQKKREAHITQHLCNESENAVKRPRILWNKASLGI